jgi:hypothetical protein
MLAVIPGTLMEWAICLGLFVVGCILFVVGNLVFGRKTGGKRLVIFAAGAAGCFLAWFLLREAFSKPDAPVIAAILGIGALVISIGLIGASFASEERVEEAFKVVLRSF